MSQALHLKKKKETTMGAAVSPVVNSSVSLVDLVHGGQERRSSESSNY